MQQFHTEREQGFIDLATTLADDFATRAAQHDEEGSFPYENYVRLKETGYTILTVPEELGGMGGQARCRAERFLTAYAAEAPDLEPGRLARYAAVEVMRRLIGVAQLPLPTTAPKNPPGPRSRLLERSRRAMTSGRVADLF